MKMSLKKIKLTAWGWMMALMLLLTLIILHSVSGTPAFAPSAYNSYTLQALAGAAACHIFSKMCSIWNLPLKTDSIL